MKRASFTLTGYNSDTQRIDLHINELREDWELARAGKELKKINPLN